MWASAGASIGVVAKLVDVHASLGGGIATLDVISDGRGRRFRRLLEGDGASNGRVTAEDCDCSVEGQRSVL